MRRGIEGVFQLLIGVFTAMMIIVVVYRVLGQVQLNRCHENWQNSAVQLANAISDAARASDTTDFVTIHGRCGGASYVSYRVVSYSGSRVCNAICHRPVPTCYAIVASAYHIRAGTAVPELIDSARYCVDISPYSYYLLTKSEALPCSSGSKGIQYKNITKDLLSKGGYEQNSVLVSAYVRSEGYGPQETIYVCAQKVI